MKRICAIMAACILLSGCGGNPREIHSSEEPHFTVADESSAEMPSSLSTEKESVDNGSVSSNDTEQSSALPAESTSSEISGAMPIIWKTVCRILKIQHLFPK